MSVLDAAYNVAHDYPGGVPSLAVRIGKNPTTLAHELNGTGTAKLGLLDAVKLSTRAQDLRICAAFAEEMNCTLLPLPELGAASASDCMHGLCVVSKEFADLCATTTGILTDGTVNDNELCAIDRAASELVASILRLRRALAEKNAAGKPEHLRQQVMAVAA